MSAAPEEWSRVLKPQTPLDPQIALVPQRAKILIDFSNVSWKAELNKNWKSIYPSEMTPAFLVDLGANFKAVAADTSDPDKKKLMWRTIQVESLPDRDIEGARALYENGWAAISYAWGEYARGSRDGWTGDRKTNGLPLAVDDTYDEAKRFTKASKPANPLDWQLPKCDVINIDVLKKIFLKFERRYVWWDWACIPQRTRKPDAGEPYLKELPKELQAMTDAEVNKQRYVYEYATTGGSYLHPQDFKQASDLKDVLKKSCDAFDPNDIEVWLSGRKTDSRLKVINHALSEPLFGPRLSIGKQDKDRNIRLDELKNSIIDIKKKLLKIRDGDGYFRSLWSFQEVRLLKTQYFFDKNANTYDLNFTTTLDGTRKMDANFLHLAIIAAFINSQLSLALAVKTNPALKKTLAAQINEDIVELCSRSDQDFEELSATLRELKGSGLAFAPQETPLQVLAAARRSRFPSAMPQDNYWAMLGCLALDGPFTMTVKYDIPVDEKSTDTAGAQRLRVLPSHRQDFLRVLLKKYQWQILQLAKSPNDTTASWEAISLGHFEPIASYFEGFIVNSLAEKKSTVYEVPFLEYNQTSDEIEMKPLWNSNKKTFTVWKMPVDITQQPSTNIAYTLDRDITWFDVEAGGDPRKNFPTGKPVDVAPSARVNLKSLGNDQESNKNRLLIPLESLSETWSSLVWDGKEHGAGEVAARCLLIENYSADKDGIYRGTFGCIMDVVGMKIESVEIKDLRLKWQ
ncbi:hypothetical protein H2198_003420 [Neophaeococcomyces mojaviensis]|uniref:Uncharacterized protein n=1 Tax=Neophaeococcomyces mojaviensis TaxID=3383035 RepID=A0ACC3ABJ6_9EURO|nr:hypothetical protein H2198_003420 [Knufia sp. JES_112]